MEIKKRKFVPFICANVGCNHIATHYFVIQNNNEKPIRIGLCEDCSFDLYAISKKAK